MSTKVLFDPEIEKSLGKWHDWEPIEKIPMKPLFCYSGTSLALDHYGPIVSAVTNIYLALDKFTQTSNAWDGKVLPRFNILTRENKGYWRHLVLCVPFLGNLIVLLYDRHAKTRAENILKGIPAGTSLSDENIEALKLAIGYGSAEAMVRLAQYHIWNGCPAGMDDLTYRYLIWNLYIEAREHGHKEAQEWDAKWEQIFSDLHALKRYKDPTPVHYNVGCMVAISIAQKWTPQMQEVLPVFEEISSFCWENPTPQKMTLLKKLCDKFTPSNPAAAAEMRARIEAYETEKAR